MSSGEIQLALRAFLEPQVEAGRIAADLAEDLPFELLERVAQNEDRQFPQANTQSWIDLLLKSAALIEAENEPKEVAISLYRLILSLDPENREAAFALGVLFHDLKKPEALIELYRNRIKAADKLGEKVTLHLYIADAFEKHLGDFPAAFSEVVTASRLDPQNLRIINQLERLGRKANQEQEVAVVLGELLLHAIDPHIRAGLALRLAELCLSTFDNPDRALAYYRSALFDDGGNPNIIQEIKDVFHETHRFVELARQLEEASKDRRTSPQRNRIERELVHLYQEDRKDTQRSLKRLQHAVDLNPNDRRLIEDMAQLANCMEDFSIFAETLEVVVSKSHNPLLVHFAQRRLGLLYANELKRRGDAIRVYETMLDEHPDHLEVLHCLGQLYYDNENLNGALDTYRRILSIQPLDIRAREASAKLAQEITALGLDEERDDERQTD